MIKFTSKTTKIFAVYLVVFFLLASFSNGLSEKEKNDVMFNGDSMSAQIEEVSLKQVLEKIKRHYSSNTNLWNMLRNATPFFFL